MKSHDNRLQQINRKIARKKLVDLLDKELNGDTSREAIRREKAQKSKERRKRRSKYKQELREAQRTKEEEEDLELVDQRGPAIPER